MPDNDAKIEIKISDNKMKVIANYFPPSGGGEGLNPSDVIEKLTDAGVTVGFQHENINSMCLSERPMRNVIVASGIPPKIGEKARIIPYFDLNERRKAMERDDGSIDFRNLGEICSARKGQDLYRKVPPTIGESGKDVMGNEIPGLPGRDLKMVVGSGTEADANDENLIKASIDGEIVVNRGVVQIASVHKVDGDVDYSTGNIIFNGAIKISGAVKAGFAVEADGDVEIAGNVEDAKITSTTDVIIHGGLAGTGSGYVKSGRDVIVKFVENQTIEAERDIILNGPAYHARLIAGRAIISQGAQSLIVGGQAEAKTSIQARKFGSDAGSVTVLKVGVDPRLAEKIKLVETEIQHAKESQEKIEKSIVFLYRQKIDNNGVLPPQKVELLKQLEKTQKALPEKLKELEARRNSLFTDQEELEKAFAQADAAVYQKVKVYFGTQFISVEDKLGPSTFKMIKGDVVRVSK